MTDVTADTAMPWIAESLQRTLAHSEAHALLIHGPSGVGQFELAQALAAAWLCESATTPLVERPCGTCPSCRLIAARSHPDLVVVVPDAMREALGWNAAEGEEGGESSKKKPSKEIRVEAVRGAIEFATTTSARGRGKCLVLHPAERLNPIAANAFLKTLEEPPGEARFLLCTSAPDRLLPTIRSRCQSIALPVPPREQAEAWLATRGVEEPGVLLAASGGQPEEALALVARGIGREDLARPAGAAAARRCDDVSALAAAGGRRDVAEALSRRAVDRLRRTAALFPGQEPRRRGGSGRVAALVARARAAG